MTIIPYTPYDPPEPPRLSWKVTKGQIRDRSYYNWCICTRCHTVTCYQVPKNLGTMSKVGRWIDENVRCARCKAFAKMFTGATPAVVDKAIANTKRERAEWFEKKRKEREGTPDE